MKQKEAMAEKMRTSVKYLDQSYLKIFPMEKEELKFQEESTRRPLTAPVEDDEEPMGAYSRQLIRNKRYYDNNKEKVLKKQKEYKDAKPLHDKARVRMLHFLNNEADYYSRMKQATKDKYKFKQENGRWV